MKYGFVLPKGDAKFAAELAQVLEAAGWDGLFVWEPVWGIDAWVSLTAAAMRTSRLRLGTMITPLSRMRPWDVAGRISTLQHLSDGRVIVAVGLGAPEVGWAAFGEVTDRATRAELLDESLAIIRGLWGGQPFEYAGKHHTVRAFPMPEHVHPVAHTRAPIWCVGALGWPKSMARALACDGLLPTMSVKGVDPFEAQKRFSPEVLRAALAEVRPQIGDRAYDVVVEGATPADDPAAARARVLPWAAAGATWWIEALWDAMNDPARVLDRARAGPPA